MGRDGSRAPLFVPSEALAQRRRANFVKRWFGPGIWLLLAAGCGDGEGPAAPSPPDELGEWPIEVSCSASPCITSVGTGYFHTCASHDDGQVLCWGWRSDGQTGQPVFGPTDYVELPSVVPSLAKVDRVVASGSNSCARAGSKLACWGYLNREDDVADGRLDPALEPLPEELYEGAMAQVMAAVRHLCVLAPDGVPLCYGGNDHGQLARETSRPADYPPDVYPEGYWYPSFEFLPSDRVDRVTRLSGALDVTCALRWDGQVQCWGRGASGVLGRADGDVREPMTIPELSGVTDVAVGSFHACAVHSGGNVSCWGKNDRGSIGSPGEDYFPPRVVAGISDARQVACSASASCAIRNNGTVWCWGSNSAGQLGLGTADQESHPAPQQVPGLDEVAHVTAGEFFFCALRASGELLCWGNNGWAELGIGPPDQDPHPPTPPRW